MKKHVFFYRGARVSRGAEVHSLDLCMTNPVFMRHRSLGNRGSLGRREIVGSVGKYFQLWLRVPSQSQHETLNTCSSLFSPCSVCYSSRAPTPTTLSPTTSTFWVASTLPMPAHISVNPGGMAMNI